MRNQKSGAEEAGSIPVTGGSVHMKKAGAPGSPRMIALHGFNDTGDTFQFLLPFLSQHFEVFMPDFRGFGDSTRIRDGYYSTANLLGDLASITGSVPPPYVLLGHSMGAAVAARFAGLVPDEVSALVLFEGFSGMIPEKAEVARMRDWVLSVRKGSDRPLRPRRVMKTMKDVEMALSRLHEKLSPDKIEAIAPGLVREAPDGFSWHYDPEFRQRFAPVPFPPLISRALWEQIECPVLFLYGSESDLLPGRGTEGDVRANVEASIKEITSHFKRIETHEIKDGSHNFHHDHPEDVLAVMKTFLKKHGLLK
ncbi:MAG: alpha/beta hydrolase [Spirochaetia bacterium]|nr:alpha/beta hydrolase [Spirochaetia bacterium]